MNADKNLIFNPRSSVFIGGHSSFTRSEGAAPGPWGCSTVMGVSGPRRETCWPAAGVVMAPRTGPVPHAGDASCPGMWSCHSRRCKPFFFCWLRRRLEIGRRILRVFLARCVSRTVWRAGVGLRGHPAASTASDTTPRGEAPIWLVGVGLDFPRCGTEPSSDPDQGGFPPVHSVQRWARVRSVSD